MRVPRSVMAVGGVVVAAAAIGFTNPKAVHAVTAALVQVTNTATNPVVTQGVGQQAGNTINLFCSVVMNGTTRPCFQVLPDGSHNTGYTVPPGETLVITSIDLTPNNITTCSSDYSIALGTPNRPGAYLTIVTSNSLVTNHFTYPSGLVIGPGVTPTLTGDIETPDQALTCIGFDSVEIFGYLTSA